MVQWWPFESVQKKLRGDPPAVVFLLCLLSLTVAFSSFAFYIQGHAVKDPDVAQDWNKILGALADLQLCVLHNETDREASGVTVQRVVSAPLLGEHELADRVPANWTYLSLLVPLMLTGGTQGHNPASFRTMLTGSHLGLKGPAGEEVLNVTIRFLTEHEGNSSLPGATTCLSLTAPAHILPQTCLPPVCPVSEEQYSGQSTLSVVASKSYKMDPQECFHMEFSPDPRFTVMLSQVDRELAMHHLMIFSGSLLTLFVVLCFIGTLSCTKSRRYHGNGLDLQKDPLLDS
ncbi:transmembrane protein 248-like isoform X2 [Arapaima gigas]